MTHRSLFACAALAVVLVLSGCGGVADELGLGRNAPDEFAVVERPPLAVPPDFDLRPPKPGAPRPQAVNMTERASDVVYGPDAGTSGTANRDRYTREKQAQTDTKSDVEAALLDRAGATKASADIRDTIDREAAHKVVGSRHLVDELLWWRDGKPPATTVDAPAEAERLRAAKDKGEPVNAGATPVIERQKTGWLGL